MCAAPDIYLIFTTNPIKQIFSYKFTDEEIKLLRNVEMHRGHPTS